MPNKGFIWSKIPLSDPPYLQETGVGGGEGNFGVSMKTGRGDGVGGGGKNLDINFAATINNRYGDPVSILLGTRHRER